MNFTYDGADLSTIIKEYYRYKDSYHIEYLNGDYSDYVCSNPCEEERINKIMTTQAIDRQEKIDMFKLESSIRKNTVNAMISSLGASILGRYQEISLIPFALGGLILSIVKAKKDSNKLKELKKYKMVLEMIKKLYNEDENNILTVLDSCNNYPVPLTINNVDKYNYRDIKVIYKRFNEKVEAQIQK